MTTPARITGDQDHDCPACDSATPGEWDDVLRVFTCPTCSTTWRRRPRGRLVPRLTPRLPGTVPELELSTELPSADETAQAIAKRERIKRLYRGARR